MYSNHENVNILTALLVAHGVRHAVVCPGSRNAPIVHNLNECPQIACYPVTDERSAGFYALGISQWTESPVAVCVTSGTALLNLAPAVAEAFYQHRSLVVVSADRPVQWIDQLDGQTLPQPDALGCFVGKAVSLPEPRDDEQRWHCNRLVNDALSMRHVPVHINVPITEPLFEFSVAQLPAERVIERQWADMSSECQDEVVGRFLSASRPMLIAGQPMNPLMDEAVALVAQDDDYVPDFVLYTGGSVVSKRLKRFLRKAKETWLVNETGDVNDPFMNLTRVIQGDGAQMARRIRQQMEVRPHPFVQRWDDLLEHIRRQVDASRPAYSQSAVVKYLEHHAGPLVEQGRMVVHYANSTAIRLANTFARHPVFCNRGVNGIEGSLSTAAGMSVVTDKRVLCVIGDLSFFYDQNALWNQNLRGNLRIVMLNNGRGGIFNQLPGLEQSAARDRYVAAEHHTSAKGICMQHQVTYLYAENEVQMQQGISRLLTDGNDRPMLLEIVTDVEDDVREQQRILSDIKNMNQ